MFRRTLATLLTPAALSVALLAVGCNKSEASTTQGGAASASPAAPAAQKKVAVVAGEDGFAPSEIKLAKGEAATLVFKRTSDKTCATAVDFPELKVKKDLPLNQEVAIEIPTGEARTLGFQCGMGMYKSKVVIQ
jgi:plastocyanin domain-containing protein